MRRIMQMPDVPRRSRRRPRRSDAGAAGRSDSAGSLHLTARAAGKVAQRQPKGCQPPDPDFKDLGSIFALRATVDIG